MWYLLCCYVLGQRKLPVVLTSSEVKRLLDQLSGMHYLMAAMLYGSGLRRIELVRLRVKDVDFDYRQIKVMFGKRQLGSPSARL